MNVAAIFLLVSAIVAVSMALPVEPVNKADDNASTVTPREVKQEDSSEQEPLSRQRRSPQGSGGIDINHQKGVGTIVSGDATGNLWKNDRGQRVDGTGRFSQVVNGPQKGSSNYGGTLTYSDPKGSVFGSVDRQKNFGTSVGLGAERNLWKSQNGRSSLDAQGSWNKVVSGPARGRPNYGGFLNFSHRF